MECIFQGKGLFVVSLDARSKSGMKSITDIVMEACKEKIERDRKRGIKNRPVRAMVVGIPNVGKSTFINSYAGKACAKTGNKPGVTKGKQWIRLNKSVEPPIPRVYCGRNLRIRQWDLGLRSSVR